MLAVLILILGTTLLTSSQRDLFFQRQQEARDKANLLAQSGLEHAAFLASQIPSQLNATLNVNTPVDYFVTGTTELFILERSEDPITSRQALVVTGEVRKSNGDVLGSRTFIVPFGPDNILQPPEIRTQAYAK